MTTGRKNVYDKTNYCTFCGTAIRSKICHHLLTVHKNEKRLMDILLLPKRCEQRMKELKLLSNEGNFKHNAEVLKQGEGQIVVGRRNSNKSTAKRPCNETLT